MSTKANNQPDRSPCTFLQLPRLSRLVRARHFSDSATLLSGFANAQSSPYSEPSGGGRGRAGFGGRRNEDCE